MPVKQGQIYFYIYGLIWEKLLEKWFVWESFKEFQSFN